MKIYKVTYDTEYKPRYERYFRKESDAIEDMKKEVKVITMNMEDCLCVNKRTEHCIDIVWVEDEYLGFTEEPVMYGRCKLESIEVH